MKSGSRTKFALPMMGCVSSVWIGPGGVSPPVSGSTRSGPAKSGSRGTKADTKTGRFEAISWPEALAQAVQQLKQVKPEQVAVVLGDQVEAETLFSVKLLTEKFGIPSVDCRQDGARLTPEDSGGGDGA